MWGYEYKKENDMYDCDEYGLNDEMQRALHEQYAHEQEVRKRELIDMLNNNECDKYEREGIIHSLRKQYNYEYKKS